MTDSSKTYVVSDAETFRYEKAPFGRKVLLLTRGGVCVEGQWYGEYGEHFWGWSPLPARDHAREAELGLRSTP